MKTCKTILCNNPVEDTIKAWGQIIAPVNCKYHRTMNRTRKAREAAYFTRSLKLHNAQCKDTVCTFGDW